MLMNGLTAAADMVCLSHLRWDFVFQRPQHLMSRCARTRRVFFIEEPIFDGGLSRMVVNQPAPHVHIVVPHLADRDQGDPTFHIRRLLNALFIDHQIVRYVMWYYTPMALAFTEHLLSSSQGMASVNDLAPGRGDAKTLPFHSGPLSVIYDCMDELSNFDGAPPGLREMEARLLARADVVLTGGMSLYEAKRHLHPNIHACPSSVDFEHFASARLSAPDPSDQQSIPHPRLGFFGVIDERMDLKLLDGVAEARPDWQLVLIGPVVKINPDLSPRRPNIHYLGSKTYGVLPDYIRGWDVALLPFARNDATRYISPTKTPEYLAAGKSVVSTSICDVVKPYGELGLVRIADTVDNFVKAVEQSLKDHSAEHVRRSDSFLKGTSWDETWFRIERLIDAAIISPASASSRVQRLVSPETMHITGIKNILTEPHEVEMFQTPEGRYGNVDV